ncbi:MAG: lytic transglycosylase domain-containing protein [Pseudomonadota bacterium]
MHASANRQSPARRTIIAVAAGGLVLLSALLPPGAAAFDLSQVRDDGAVIREALSMGERGDWASAQALAGRSGDLVLSDIVLWRKLRAGDGTVAEYQSYVDRRADWPGQSQLSEAVFGNRPASPNRLDALTGQALRNWRQFSRLWRARDWDEAELLLDRLSTSPAGLGVPDRWANRRATLARRAARNGRAELAYRLATRAYTTKAAGYDNADLKWIAGWIALTKLNNPRAALGHFEAFAPLVNTPISNGRAGYWIGRAQEALGNAAAAEAAYASAARYQTSFYGQLAAAKIGAPGDPALLGTELTDWRTTQVARDDAVRMAATLHYAGESSLAWQSFRHLGRRFDTQRELAAVGSLALEMGQQHYAVRVAKEAARKEHLIMPAYYPVIDLAQYVDRVEPALAMSLARQETELNPRAISPAGARGLMQLMPATAQKVAGWIGEPYDRGRLITDWQYNARLGQTYLARRISEFGGSYVLAAASYNAGKGRIDNWVVDYGNPLLGEVDIIDWMEMIPFSETRNYVQRVMEGIYVYRTRLSGRVGPMTIERDLARGIR